MNELIYLVGPPGVGKSTLLANLTSGCNRQSVTRPFAHDVLTLPQGGRAVELGAQRPQFSGTDALSMSVQPKVLSWMLTESGYPYVLGEGDRLGNRKFLGAVLDIGWKVTLLALTLPLAELDLRCARRGSAQAPSWRQGRQTKVWNLVEWAGDQQLGGAAMSVYQVSTHASPYSVWEATRLMIPTLRSFS